MSDVVWFVDIDLDRDQTFDHADGDITGRLVSAQWNNGMLAPGQLFAPPAQMTLIFDNSDGALISEQFGAYHANFKEGTLIRVRSLHEGSLRQHCVLPIANIDFRTQAGTALPYATVFCQDPTDRLLDMEYRPQLQTNITTDVAIRDIIEGVKFAYPYPAWTLGSSTHSQLGSTTTFPNYSAIMALDTGDITVPYFGDLSGREDNVSAGTDLRLINETERGRFFFDTRSGKFTFHSRYRDFAKTSNDLVITEGQILNTGTVLTRIDVQNVVTVDFQPRSTGSAGTVLWSADNLPITLRRNQELSFTARYQDPAANALSVAGQDMITPLSSTDYIANSKSDGTGDDRTADLRVLVQFESTAAKITLINQRTTRPYRIHVTTLQLRGTPLTLYDRQTVTVTNVKSKSQHNAQAGQASLPMVDDPEQAFNLAALIGQEFGEDLDRFDTIAPNLHGDDALVAAILPITVGSRIGIDSPRYSHINDYIVVGETWQVDQATGQRGIQWIVRAWDNVPGWVLDLDGRNEVGVNTIPVAGGTAAVSGWTDLKTWSQYDELSAADLNTYISNNVEWLKDPPFDTGFAEAGTDYQTSSASWADVDATNLSVTITTTGGDVMVGFTASVARSTASGYVYFDIDVDGVRNGGDDGIIGMQNPDVSDGNKGVQFDFIRLITGLSAAEHTFKLQWKLEAASGNATLAAQEEGSGMDVRSMFWAREIT